MELNRRPTRPGHPTLQPTYIAASSNVGNHRLYSTLFTVRHSFWRDVILPATTEANRDTLLGRIEGASIYDFVDSRAQGTFQGRQYSSPDLTSVHLPNHVPTEHCSWVTTEVEQLVSTGCITRWADVADTSLYTKPHMVLPLGVGPKEPRLIWDARWLHRRRVHSPLYHGWRGKSSSVRVTQDSPGDNRP